MGKNTSIALGEHFEEFVQGQVGEGRYKSTSEVIRAGLRLLESEEQKVKILRQAIQEGIDSGIALDFNPEEYLEQLNEQKKKNA